jgi:serine/threonine protein kinase
MARIGDAKAYRNLDRRAIMDKARELVEEEVARSTIFDADAVDALSKFSPEEVGLGRVVGRGGFCVVRECASIKLLSSALAVGAAGTSAAGTTASNAAGSPAGESTGGPNATNATPDSSVSHHHHGPVQHASSFPGDRPTAPTGLANSNYWSHLASSEHGLADPNSNSTGRHQRRYPSEGLESFSSNQVLSETREQLARRVWAKRGSHRYVVKKVEPELFHEDRLTYLKGVVDLALETQYLAALSTQHPHILRIRGVSAAGPYQPGYFIVLDRLHDVLSKRLTAWMHRHRSTKGLTGALTGGRRKVKDLLIERLLVATDVASAVEFLHSRNVIYRDLKPDNVGFDGDGSVKIFDFGLAKELNEAEMDEDGLYHMTGFTGTTALRFSMVSICLCFWLAHA